MKQEAHREASAEQRAIVNEYVLNPVRDLAYRCPQAACAEGLCNRCKNVTRRINEPPEKLREADN
jgi:hypothetical protein